MKYFRKKGKTITLETANPKYQPIVPETELRIAGVITAVVSTTGDGMGRKERSRRWLFVT